MDYLYILPIFVKSVMENNLIKNCYWRSYDEMD